jgi:hypothetical protein
MKTYRMTIQTSFYKNIEVQAKDEDSALDEAYEWMEKNDALEWADQVTEVHDIEEVEE